MRVDKLLESTQENITLTNGKVLVVGDECLAGHPLTLRHRRATIIGFIKGSGIQRAIVRDTHGETWIVSRYALKVR